MARRCLASRALGLIIASEEEGKCHGDPVQADLDLRKRQRPKAASGAAVCATTRIGMTSSVSGLLPDLTDVR